MLKWQNLFKLVRTYTYTANREFLHLYISTNNSSLISDAAIAYFMVYAYINLFIVLKIYWNDIIIQKYLQEEYFPIDMVISFSIEGFLYFRIFFFF